MYLSLTITILCSTYYYFHAVTETETSPRVNGRFDGKSGFKPRSSYAKQSSFSLDHVALQVFWSISLLPTCPSVSSLFLPVPIGTHRDIALSLYRYQGRVHASFQDPVASITEGSGPLEKGAHVWLSINNRPRITSQMLSSQGSLALGQGWQISEML